MPCRFEVNDNWPGHSPLLRSGTLVKTGTSNLNSQAEATINIAMAMAIAAAIAIPIPLDVGVAIAVVYLSMAGLHVCPLNLSNLKWWMVNGEW